jgi:aminoglycoside phosphotransferase (APT) family kinase protein
LTPDGDEPDPAAVIAAFGLPGPVAGWDPVGGAWSNRVFRLVAAGRCYAVKEMRNPWADPRWEQWLAESWVFERRAIAAGVAAPRPVPEPASGGCLAWVSRRDPALGDAAVRVHHWVHGHPHGPGPVTMDTARWAGQVLATLHGLRVRPRDRSLFPVPDTKTARRWPDLAQAAQCAGAAWAHLLTAAAPAVALIADLATSAGYQPGQEVITHGDIDQKNLIATAQGPVLCDWDLATPLVPRRELADVALSLGWWENFAVSRQVLRSYRQAGGDDTPIGPPDLGPSLMNGLDWAAFNVERAIGLRPATEAETTLARTLTPGLLAAIPHQAEVTMRISDILKSG